MQQDPEVLNLKRLVGVLRRRAILIGLCIVVAGGAAYAFSKHQTKKYTATASLVFVSNPLSQQVTGLSSGGSANSSSLLVQQANDLELVKSGETAAKTASSLGHGLSSANVIASLSISGRGESGVVDVTATSRSPVLAAALANTYTRQFVSEQVIANRKFFRAALVLVRKQLASLSREQRVGTDGVALQNRAQTLGLLAELNDGNVQVAQEALTPSGPSSPKTSRNTAIGILLGLLLGLAIALVRDRLDRRIGDPEDLGSIYRLPLLGTVPDSAALSRPAHDKSGKRSVLPVAEAEAFSLIRAHLRFFNVNRDLRTVVVASPTPGDGKSTIAWHLAEAAARFGSRVLLIEADLRHPTLARRLGIQSGPGLAEVLIGAARLDDAIQSVRLEAEPGEGARDKVLDVLAVDEVVLPPNPGELLESNAMNTVIERTMSQYDLVLIDTPPLTVVSDAFPLLTKVDGVVIVGRVEHSRCDAAESLHQILASSGAPLLGVIANGAKSSVPGSYAYTRDTSAVALTNESLAPAPEQTITTTSAG